MEDDERQTIAEGHRSFDLDDRSGTLIGEEVGGYVIEDELGRGGMGVVYAATHPMIGKRAAIKVIKPSLSKNPATVERFVQEARSVNQIGHPSIVDIFAFGTLPDGRSYFVMDLLEGEPLRKRLKRGALPLVEAALLIDEIASALAAAHDKGFIHRDLKPDNVFLVAHPNRFDIKLLDFGLAKLAANATTFRAYRTATGAQLGTPDYMSPEQLRGTGVDHRTDIFALGVLAFEALTGVRPRRFGDGTVALDDGGTLRDGLRAAAVPENLADLVEAMVARDPDGRPTLAAIRAVLKRIRPSLQMQAAAVEPLPDMSLGSLPPALLGAQPVLPTPPAGAPLPVSQPPVSRPPMSRPPVSQPPVSRPPVSQPPMSRPPMSRPPMSQPPMSQPPMSQPPMSQPPMSQPPMSPALRVGNIPVATKLGVGVGDAAGARPRVTSSSVVTRSESRVWLAVGLVLVLASAVALVVVLAT